ncbi:cytochrome P450 [Mycobacterium sp. CVI_P3]|uniref:Cytochrome P450 n=1 Tax=Mycobacterium pinniadriaticum TaxID=2994102 RepID=A0ABT3SBY6_9MYCO|nr:cytochrome P450 [Mycobacterium pinniadriaticum]MCX2929954.1 cytochrome P450 [Mycobacterium pinniadriaticum]MCX2936397.1 cytochrome P450 [Mycobacterium pinniadriaticum]
MTTAENDYVFNPLDPELAVDPFPILARLRAVDPVFHAEGLGAYVVTGHDAAREVLARKDGDVRWEQFQRMRHGDDVVNQPYFTIMADSVLMKAGEDHRRVRQTFQRNFRPGLVDSLRPAITERAHQLIDAFVDPSGGPGQVELMAAFASPLPLSAISQLLRVPQEDEADIHQWMHGFKLAVQMLPLDAKQLKVANDSMSALDTYFRGLVARRRNESVDDLVNKMIADTDNGTLTEDELIANLWSIYVGGHDTSALSICNAMVTLLRNPDQLRALQNDMSLLPNAVQEILRHIGTVHGTHRLLTEDIELGGHHIPADTPIMVYLSAANHDESWCPHAEQFDITRDVPPDHLAFGHGPHKCPGQHMARAVIGIGVEALLSRLHGLRLEELEWDTDALLFRGPTKLVLAWDESRSQA